MKFERRYTAADRPVEEQIEWKTVTVTGLGKAVAVPEVEVPVGWSDNAAAILADKYLRKAGVPSDTIKSPEGDVPRWLLRSYHLLEGISFGPETSARQCFHRLAGCWTYWGWKEGYFRERQGDGHVLLPIVLEEMSERNARIFYDEVYMMLALQVAAPNSPQWFNTGLHWAYGIEGPDSGMWYVDHDQMRQ